MNALVRSEPFRFDQLLDWIEARLDDPLTLTRIAQEAQLSPYHFSRMFTACTGRSVMYHVRYRRMAKAARRIVAEADLKLTDLAFDCGFDSQEAFTRAFTRLFGTSPGRLRSAYRAPAEFETAADATTVAQVQVERLPGLVQREAFRVAGLSHRFDDATKLAIPGLWRRLAERVPYAPPAGQPTYGVMWSEDRDSGAFGYMAAVRVDASVAAAEGLQHKDVPANTYAAFRLTMTGGPVHPQVVAAMRHIWGELIPASQLVAIDAPEFEYYDGVVSPDQAGAVIDYYVPVTTHRSSR